MKLYEKLGEASKHKQCRISFVFDVLGGILYRRCVFRSGRHALQLVVPKSLRSVVLGLGHDAIMAGHQGVKSTLSRVTEEFFWPGIYSEVRRYVNPAMYAREHYLKDVLARLH